MPQHGDKKPPRRRTFWVTVALIASVAVLMGFPTLRGTFVGGDDHRLVLNHILVNHPSFTHAIQLFGIVHRDLYQPLPLLSFSAEFAVADVFGLFDKSIAGGAWLFHLTNILLHAVNAVLVWVVIKGLHPERKGRSVSAVATVAAVLFAIHPLQVEVVAWLNGRMMLLSTLFALASLATLATWLSDGRRRWAVLTVLFVTCCAISKIRVGLPLLLVIVLLARRERLTWRFTLLWLICTAVTAVFAVVNYGATAEAGMFSGAAEHLHGSRMVRALLALAWYFQHFLWPTGLASWYPTPGMVYWSAPATVCAIAIVVPVLAIAGWSAWRSRDAALGFAWFFVTIASTVQLVPTRNALAADRYMYLPMIGLLWLASLVLCRVYGGARCRWSPVPVRIAAGVMVTVGAVAMIAMSWHVAGFYETPVRKSRRIAELFSEVPHVWERLAWALHNAGAHEEAITVARREFAHDDDGIRSDAYQVIGVSQFHLGDQDAAFASLRRSIEADPRNSQAKYHFAKILAEAGHFDEALPLYEESIALAPLANPRIVRLASLYRRLHRPTDARRMYEQAFENNRYDVKATMGLAELDIAAGTVDAYRAAEGRLLGLLNEMPENTDAWVNLGVARSALGRTAEAIEAYQTALAREPRHATAALNLAVLYQDSGAIGRAAPLFEHAAEGPLESVEQVTAVHDFFVAQGAVKRAVTLWDGFLERFPDSLEGRAFAAWSRALAGDLAGADREAASPPEATPPHPLATATRILVALAEERYGLVVERADALCALDASGADARQRLLSALEAFDREHPNVPWTYCLASQLLIADGRLDGARVSVDLCDRHCRDSTCRDRVQWLRVRLPDTSAEIVDSVP